MYNLNLSDILGQFRKDCRPTWWSKSAARKLGKLKTLDVDQGGRGTSSASNKKKSAKRKTTVPSPKHQSSYFKPTDQVGDPLYGRCNMLMASPSNCSMCNHGYYGGYGMPYGAWYGNGGDSSGIWSC